VAADCGNLNVPESQPFKFNDPAISFEKLPYIDRNDFAACQTKLRIARSGLKPARPTHAGRYVANNIAMI
jgi:hypothetical protein